MNAREFIEFQIKMECFRTEYEDTRKLFMDALRAELGISKGGADKTELKSIKNDNY